MNYDHNDITNDVYFPKRDPWESFDEAVGMIRDALAVIGLFCVIIASVLWWIYK